MYDLEMMGADKPAKGAKDKAKTGDKNWLVRPVVGPVPGAGVLAIGAAVLGGLGYAVKRIFFK